MKSSLKLLYLIAAFSHLVVATNIFANGGDGGGSVAAGVGVSGLDSVTGAGGPGGNTFPFGAAGGGGEIG